MSAMTETEEKLLNVVTAHWTAGREIARKYHEAFDDRISYGTLYVTLRRLVEAGLVERQDGVDEDGLAAWFKLTGGSPQPDNAMHDPLFISGSQLSLIAI